MTSQPPNRRMLLVATAAVAIAAWWVTVGLPWPARLCAVFLLVLLPTLTLLQLQSMQKAGNETGRRRLSLYASSAVAIWFLGGIALLAAILSHFTPTLLGLTWSGIGNFAFWTLLSAGAGLSLMVGARLLGVRETALLELVIPRTPRERLAFIGLALSAGVGEEFAYRSFLVPALTYASGSMWFSAAIAAVAFGMVHGYQGMSGVARSAGLGFILAIPLVITGSVLPAMAAHALIDLAGGLWLADWMVRRG
jgi:CAAX protease family protein